MSLSTSQRAVRNGLSHFGAVAINIVMGFLVMPAIVHGIGLAEFGIWAVANTFVGFMGLLDLGLGQTLIKKSSELLAKQDEHALGSTVNLIFTLYVLLSLPVLGLCLALVYFAPLGLNIPMEQLGKFQEVLLILGLLTTLSFPMSVLNGLVGGLQDFYFSSVLNASLNVVKAAFTFVLLAFGYGLVALVLLGAAMSVLGWVVTFIWIRRRIPGLSIKVAMPQTRLLFETTRFSASMFIWAIAGQSMQAMDRVILGVLFPVSAVGVYEIGARLNTLSRTTLSVAFIANPATSELFARGEHAAARHFYLQGTKYVFGASGAAFAAVMLFGHEFVALWMGAGFGESVLVAQILIVATFFQSQNAIGHVMLVGMGHVRTFTMIMAMYPILITAAGFLFGVTIGVIGVAMGITVTIFLLESIMLAHLCGRMSTGLIELIRHVHLRVLTCIMVSGIVIWTIEGHLRAGSWSQLVLKAVIFAVLYAALFSTICMSRAERQKLFGRLAAPALSRMNVKEL
jgi:O-antigen/teichoic acid export membrane protein